MICFGQSENTIGVQLSNNGVYNGLTLFSPVHSGNTYLINNCGQIVNQWASDYPPGSSVYLNEDGLLIRTAKNSNPNFTNPKGPGGRIEIFDWNNDLLWDFNYNTDNNLQHHDIALLPNGNILVLAWDIHSFEESVSMGRNPELMSENEIWSEHILEIDPSLPNGENIIWEWYLWDHLIQDFDSEKLNYGVISEHPELMNINYVESTMDGDWVHANALDYNEELDQIVMSSRNMNELWVIDHSTTTAEAKSHAGGKANMGGDILYRWGNPKAYESGTDVDQTLFGQHDVHWIPKDYEGGGNIMIFNNGFRRTSGVYSSIDVIQPPLAGFNYTKENTYFGPYELDWSYTATIQTDFYSFFMSGAERLPNGNTLICSSYNGTIFEINDQQEVVWEYINPDTQRGILSQGESTFINSTYDNLVFRAEKYSLDFSGFIGKDLTANETIENGTISEPCLTTSLDRYQNEFVTIYPQPATDILRIAGVPSEFVIYDVFGKLKFNSTDKTNKVEIDISEWNSGIYILTDNKSIFKKIIKR